MTSERWPPDHTSTPHRRTRSRAATSSFAISVFTVLLLSFQERASPLHFARTFRVDAEGWYRSLVLSECAPNSSCPWIHAPRTREARGRRGKTDLRAHAGFSSSSRSSSSACDRTRGRASRHDTTQTALTPGVAVQVNMSLRPGTHVTTGVRSMANPSGRHTCRNAFNGCGPPLVLHARYYCVHGDLPPLVRVHDDSLIRVEHAHPVRQQPRIAKGLTNVLDVSSDSLERRARIVGEQRSYEQHPHSRLAVTVRHVAAHLDHGGQAEHELLARMQTVDHDRERMCVTTTV